MKKKEKCTAVNTAQREIRRLIMNYVYKQGSRLYEPALAEQLKMSRTPVREALTRLVSCGFLERSEGKRGYRVPNLTREDMRHVFHLRLVLEQYAAELFARHMDEKSIDRLYVLNDCEREALYNNDRERYSELNEEFHALLIEQAKVPYLIRYLGEITSRTTLYNFFYAGFYTGSSGGSASTRTVPAYIEHRAIIDALARKSFDQAKILMREHTLAAYRHCLEPASPADQNDPELWRAP